MEEHKKRTSKLSAFDRAMNYLTYRDRTEAEIVKYLQDKNYSDCGKYGSFNTIRIH